MAAVVRPDGHLLLVKPWYRRGWGLPGGFFRRAEQADEALRRELSEEVDLNVAMDVSLASAYVQSRYRHVDHVFEIQISDAEANSVQRRSRELRDLAWFPLDALPRLQPEATEALRRLRLLGGSAT